MINELHESIFQSTMAHLPNLVGLHVVGCPKLDHIVVLRQASHTPLLESLSLTVSVGFSCCDYILSYLILYLGGIPAANDASSSPYPSQISSTRCQSIDATIAIIRRSIHCAGPSEIIFTWIAFFRAQTPGPQNYCW